MPQKSRRAFFVDENTSRTLVSKLLSLGHKAEHVYEVGLKGHPDEDIFAYAQTHKQTIITADLDFSNVLHYPPPHYGVIVVRIPDNVPVPERIQEIINTLDALPDEDFMDTLIIIEKGRFRIRASK